MRKTAGPDGISFRELRDCADQLCGVVRHIFNLILNLERMPTPWKTSCLVPVPKWLHPRELKPLPTCGLDLMKTLERMVLKHLRHLAAPTMDPLQFAYWAEIGLEDAVIYLMHRSLSHPENTGCAVSVTYFDFSRLQNCPAISGEGEAGGSGRGLSPDCMDH